MLTQPVSRQLSIFGVMWPRISQSQYRTAEEQGKDAANEKQKYNDMTFSFSHISAHCVS